MPILVVSMEAFVKNDLATMLLKYIFPFLQFLELFFFLFKIQMNSKKIISITKKMLGFKLIEMC